MKKLLASVLALAMALSMVAVATAEDAGTIKIGVIGPMTGAAATYGTAVANGAKIAADEINALGGVQLELLVQDDEHDAEKAINAYNTVMDEGAQFILGTVTTSPCIAVAAQAYEERVFMLTPSASSTEVTEGKDNVYQVCFTDPAQGTASANYIADNNLGKKIAVFYQSDIDYSAGLYETFTQQAAARGLEIVAQQSFTEGTKTDFSTQINAIRNSGCDLVFIPIYAAEASVFLTQAKGKLDGMTIFGCDGLDGLQTKVSDTSMLKGTMMLTPFAVDAPDAKTQSFVEKFTKVHGSKPDQFAADAYDAVYAVKAAMESSGKTPADADFTTAMVDTMYKITVDGLTGTMKWDADREPDKAAKAMVFNEDGTTSLFAE